MDPTPAHTRAASDVAGLTDRLRTLPQYLLPTHALSRIVHRATRSTISWWKDLLIDLFCYGFEVAMEEAEVEDRRAYPSFNAFFTRALKADARPLADGDTTLLQPVDGSVCHCGPLEQAALVAKGHQFDATALLGGSQQRAAPFAGGTVANLYLSPSDYHRIHMPLDGRLVEQVYVPGRLFAVNPPAVRTVPGLFARNERVALIFDTAIGPVAIVLVGALFVGSIETVWSGEITPPHRSEIALTRYDDGLGPELKRGEELGRFNMGSTVIMLFPPERIALNADLDPGHPVRLGQPLGELLPAG
jgi:phosphatidylserine decarboxylase